MAPMSLGERIKEARRAAGLSQAALGAAIGSPQDLQWRRMAGLEADEVASPLWIARKLVTRSRLVDDRSRVVLAADAA